MLKNISDYCSLKFHIIVTLGKLTHVQHKKF